MAAFAFRTQFRLAKALSIMFGTEKGSAEDLTCDHLSIDFVIMSCSSDAPAVRTQQAASTFGLRCTLTAVAHNRRASVPISSFRGMCSIC